jgi:hypothetical protein
MDQQKARQLMARTYERPCMRVTDYLLDLDEEAQPAADAMYKILEKDYIWNWPDQDKHFSGMER